MEERGGGGEWTRAHTSMLVGGGVEDAYRNSNRHAGEGHKHKHEAGEWAAA